MIKCKVIFKLALMCIALNFIVGCVTNSPYRSDERGKNIYYTTFDEEPNHLDPARSYSSNEYELIGQIYEPPLQYHYLKRPYQLTPLTAEVVPIPLYLDKHNMPLPNDVLPEKVYRTIYEIKIRKGIMFQYHPALAKDEYGRYLYTGLSKGDLRGINEIKDFPYKGTKELTADDYIYQIMRLADPQLHSPVLSILEEYILGLKEFSEALHKDLDEIRRKRRDSAGSAYSQLLDERRNPIVLDYKSHDFPGVDKIDDYTFRIILKTKYPQFMYWLAMPFFSPMPEEVARFYKQGELEDRNITLDRFPVGTGPYRIDTYNPNMEIALVKNENFHEERYPVEGEATDAENGLLEDASKLIPFIDKIVFKLEKEAIPRWNKFLQGYFDSSGITSDSFDQAVNLSAEGRAELTSLMNDKGITLITSVRPSTYYMGFNMLDDEVGGYSEKQQKLRQAISIAINYEEYIEIFSNGRGIPAMSPLPPGIFGYIEGEGGINPYVYRWNTGKARAERKPIAEAKELLAEAGYRNGRDNKGNPLVITFDNAWTGADGTPMINWLIKRLKLLGIQLENRTTDYNRFQEKMISGNFQLFSWGWNADYPDPENFFFLLTSDNSKVKYKGENAANYNNEEFDRLFTIMKSMDNTEERSRIISNMLEILHKDAPWIWGYHPVAFGLSHQWIKNLKSNTMANNTMKYLRVDIALRNAKRSEWNKPNFWPLVVLIIIILAGSLPAIISVKRRLGIGGRG